MNADQARKLMAVQEWRTCEFCGCHTNARLRRCCDRGYRADGGAAQSSGDARPVKP